jgi:hypothetical protein
MWLGMLLLLLASADAGAPDARQAPRASLAPQTPPRYPLRPVRGGGYEYEDDHIKARVAEDGRVTFATRGLGDAVKWLPFLPEDHPPGTQTLQGSVLSLLGRGGRKAPTLPPPIPLGTRLSPNEPMSRRDIDTQYLARRAALPLLMIKVDINDLYLRLMGEDPYRYDKARFLTETFELRMRLATRSHAAAVRRSLETLPAQLEALWNEGSRPTFERKLVLCELWAELDESDPAARKAARLIQALAARKLPPASPDRYTDQDLEACNAGQTAPRRFSPYREPPGAAPSGD